MDDYGRPNCVGEQDGGPHRDLTPPDEDTHSLLDFISGAFHTPEDPWTTCDTVVTMGAHSLGGLVRDNNTGRTTTRKMAFGHGGSFM